MAHLSNQLSGLAPLPVERILVGVSLDGGDERVLTTAGAIAGATGARLIVVHASEPPDALLLELPGTPPPDDGRAELDARIGRWVPPEVQRSVEVLPGAAHRVLMEVAARTSPHLIVVGASTDDGKLLGSTAERVARKASVPVLVVRGRAAGELRRVVAPVDLSDLSGSGLHRGLAMASRLAGKARLEVVAPFAIGFLDPLSHDMRRHGSTTEQMTAAAGERLERFVGEHLPEVAVDAETQVVLGPAREVIVATAQRAGADLVVMSTHGYGGFERLMLGSVAAGVLREAPCSVLLVPPEAALGDDIAEAIVTQTAPAKWADL